MRILWSSQDPSLVGPYAGDGAGAALPFEVPAGGGVAPAFATVFAGDAWPPGLPPIDRLVALPRIEDDGVGSRARAADVILWCTGFRSSLDHLAPLDLRGPDGGILMTGRLATQVAKDPRVHLVGYGPSASTIGANRAGGAAASEMLEQGAIP